jgi:RimJ/RimL family protein N-acetyltransferase
MHIETLRLKLIPATPALARAEIARTPDFSRLLGASVPRNWPPQGVEDALPLFLDWLEAAPEAVGWYSWYALDVSEPAAASVLVGCGGFLGPPQDGGIELGYSVLEQFQGRGYGTEMVAGLVQWSLAQPGVEIISAETESANPASERVLIKSGFSRVGAIGPDGGERFELGRQEEEPRSDG